MVLFDYRLRSDLGLAVYAYRFFKDILTCAEFFRGEWQNRETVYGNVLSCRQKVEGEQQHGHRKQVVNVDKRTRLKKSCLILAVLKTYCFVKNARSTEKTEN
jgi:hypothetical protein